MHWFHFYIFSITYHLRINCIYFIFSQIQTFGYVRGSMITLPDRQMRNMYLQNIQSDTFPEPLLLALLLTPLWSTCGICEYVSVSKWFLVMIDDGTCKWVTCVSCEMTSNKEHQSLCIRMCVCMSQMRKDSLYESIKLSLKLLFMLQLCHNNSKLKTFLFCNLDNFDFWRIRTSENCHIIILSIGRRTLLFC